jgi:hypothetical protein
MEQVTSGWRWVHIGHEADGVEIAGLRLWDIPWGRSLGRIVVAHPSYPEQRHAMDGYRTPEGAVDFAAGELSGGVWGFYEPDRPDVPR